jgi:hypothetical protein
MIKVIIDKRRPLTEFTLDNIKKGITFIYKENKIKVFVTNGYIDIEPNPTSDWWNVNAFDKYSDEILGILKKELYKNPKIVKVSEVFCNGEEEYWYFDTEHNNLFYIDEKGKLHYHTAKDNISYESELESAYDRFHINREIITDNYLLTSEDLEELKDTDIDLEEFRVHFIRKYKGQYKNHDMVRYLMSDFNYKYKYFFKCERCGKGTFHWHKHIPGAFVDYFGPYYCEDCKEIAEKEKKEEYDRKYNSDPGFRKQEDDLKELFKNIKPIRIKPQMISSKLFEERPMAPPRNEFYASQELRFCKN